MDTDPKTPPEDEADEPMPIVPDVEDAKQAAENIEEKGEPFDSNFA